MSRAWILAVALVAVAPVAEAAGAGAIEIRHDPIPCTTFDRYFRVTATAIPPEQVATADLQFRGSAAGGWYAVAMAAEGAVWSGVLPRPMRSLEGFEYRIVMRSADLQESATAPFAVRVGEGSAECGGTQASVVVEAPIVIRVPAGAPVVPPVPPGFSPAGVVAAAEATKKSGSTVKWVALAGVAGGAAAAAVAAGSAAQPEPLPTGIPASFEFFGASPIPGSVLSLSRDRLVLTIRIVGGDRVFLDLLWRIDLLGGTGESACAVMFGTHAINAIRPQVVDLTSRPVPSGSCGTRFDVETARLTLMVEGQVAYDQTHVLPYHFEP